MTKKKVTLRPIEPDGLPLGPPLVVTWAEKLARLFNALVDVALLAKEHSPEVEPSRSESNQGETKPEAKQDALALASKPIRLEWAVNSVANYYQEPLPSRAMPKGLDEFEKLRDNKVEPMARFPRGVHRKFMLRTKGDELESFGPLQSESVSLALEEIGWEVLRRIGEVDADGVVIPLPMGDCDGPLGGCPDEPRERLFDDAQRNEELYVAVDRAKRHMGKTLAWIRENLTESALRQFRVPLLLEMENLATEISEDNVLIYQEDGNFTLHATIFLLTLSLLSEKSQQGEWILQKNWTSMGTKVRNKLIHEEVNGCRMDRTSAGALRIALGRSDFIETRKDRGETGNGLRLSSDGRAAATRAIEQLGKSAYAELRASLLSL